MHPSPQPSTPDAAAVGGLRPENPPFTALTDLAARIGARLEWIGSPGADVGDVTGVE